MTEWNLSVRLTGQGSGLSRTLRDTARDARAASRDVNALRRDIARLRASTRSSIRVRLGVDARHLRTDVRSALTTAGAGQGLRVRLDVDAGHLRTDVSAALSSAGAGQGLAVNLRLANAMQLRRDVENAVRWAAWGHRIDIPIGLADPMQLRRDVSAAVRWASMTQTIRVRVEPDTSALTTLGGAPGSRGGSRSGGANFGLKGLLLLAPAAIPLLAGLSTGLAPLPGMFAAGGTAAAAFGIAIAGQIEPLTEVADAEKKYQDAVRDHGRSSKEAMEAQLAYQRILADMPPETQKAAVALSQLRQDFGAWSDEMAGFTMTPLTHGIAVLDQLIPRLTPHVESASGQLDRLITIAGGAVATPGFDAMADRFADFTDRQLDEMTDKVIHFMRVLSEGGPTSGPLQEFMAYARENGPEAREAISAISAAVVTLMRGAAEAGPSMLTLVTAAARLVAALPPELVGIIIQVATALKLLQLSGAGMAALAAGLGRVRTQIAAVGTTAAAAGGGLAGLRAAFIALGTAAKASVIVAGIAALVYIGTELSNLGKSAPPNVDRLTTSLGNLGRTGKATGYVAQQFGADFGKLNEQIKKVTNPSVVESINNWGADITNGLLDAGDATEEFTKNADAIDKSLTNLVRNGNAELAKAALADMLKGLDPKEAEKLRGELENYDQALADLAFEQQHAAESMGVFGQAAQDTQAKLDAQKQSADGLRQSIQALNAVNREGGGAMNAFEQSIDDAAKAAADNAGALRMSKGELDLNSQAARDAESALRDLAANTDDAAVKAREQGKSWEYVQGILTRGQEAFVTTAQKMGLTKAQAQALAQSYIDIPDSTTTTVQMRSEDAIAGLNAVIAAIEATPNAHTVKVDTLNAAAIAALEQVGLKTRQLKDGHTEVYTANGQSLGSIGAVRDALERLDGKTANTYTNHHVTTYSQYVNVGPRSSVPGSRFIKEADGGVVDYYADGGVRGRVRAFANGGENHVAQIARAGSWRIWAEDETGGESYIPLHPSKRVRSRAIAEETVRRLGGDPAMIQWNAGGSVTDWRYDPNTGSLYSPSDAGQAGRKTKKVKGKEVTYFDLGAVEKKLKSISAATTTWNNDLAKVADRVGGDVAEALASMGEEGKQLAHKMATGSTKYINEMAAALRNLQRTARASLTDYTRQLTNANKVNKDFADDLAKLAAMGYGDLASQLAAQGDAAAQQLADAASRDQAKAAKANAQAKTANNALTGDQMAQLVQIIAAITTNKVGIHDVAAKTQIGEDEIIEVANTAKGQISSSLGSRASKFLADLAKANAHQAYADGGIRAGIFATRAGIIRFAEPETGGEAFLPLAASKRRTALPVLADVAHRFGLGLTDAQAGRPVVVVRHGDNITVPVTPVRTGASASDIGFQVGRSVRRARRGGVNARAGA